MIILSVHFTKIRLKMEKDAQMKGFLREILMRMDNLMDKEKSNFTMEINMREALRMDCSMALEYILSRKEI